MSKNTEISRRELNKREVTVWRNDCGACVFKHVANAMAASREIRNGYAEPFHLAVVLGELGMVEAHAEAIGTLRSTNLAARSRAVRSIIFDVVQIAVEEGRRLLSPEEIEQVNIIDNMVLQAQEVYEEAGQIVLPPEVLTQEDNLGEEA